MKTLKRLTSGCQQRTMTVPAEIDESRTIEGLAVPYDQWQEIWPGTFERFMPGALTPDEHGVKLRLEHAETIGVVSEIRQTDHGAEITATISATRAGDDAYTLARDGALSSLSIGFMPDPDAMDITESEGQTWITHNRADLLEVSLVSFPAYDSANLTDVRHRNYSKETTMDETTTDLAEIRQGLDDLDRTVKDLGARMDSTTAPTCPLAAYRSAGDFVKAVATGSPDAIRAATDAVTADTATQPAWVNRTLDLMTAKQRVTELFTHTRALPSEGMSIEFPQFDEDTLTVAEQENEGDTLKFGKIKLSHGSAPVVTYGGASKVSRQVAERASSTYLSTLHRLQAVHYAATIEAATVALAKATVEQQTTSSPITLAKAATAITVNDIIDVLIDMAAHYDDTLPYSFDGVLVSSDVYKHLAKLDEQPKALAFTNAPDGRQGTVTLPSRAGNLAGISVHPLPGTTGVIAGYSSVAINIDEQGGAPWQLSDDDITTLTKTFSVYGYAAHYSAAPRAIVPVKFGA